MEFFKDKNKPTMNELVYWMQVNHTDLVNDMKMSNHNAAPDEPNPYHIEDSVWTHTMMVCLRAEIDSEEEYNKIPLITALLHDLGKPESRAEIPFEAKKPVHTESNQIRTDGINKGKDSGMQRVIKKFPDEMIDNMSDEQLLRRFYKEYDEFLKGN